MGSPRYQAFLNCGPSLFEHPSLSEPSSLERNTRCFTGRMNLLVRELLRNLQEWIYDVTMYHSPKMRLTSTLLIYSFHSEAVVHLQNQRIIMLSVGRAIKRAGPGAVTSGIHTVLS